MFAEGKVVGNGDVKQVTYGDDSGLFVEFYWREVKNEAKSLAEGRPIFESREYIKIIAAGDKTKTWDRPVQKTHNGTTPSDLDRFHRQWAAFQRQDEQVTEGTPLAEWPQITRSDAAMLKSHGIHTVETLAALSDANVTNILGGRSYREMAKSYLAKAKEGAGAAQLAIVNQNLQDQITALTNQIKGLTDAGLSPQPQALPVNTQEATAPPAPKKRGPKPKVKDEQNVPTINSTSG
jgi:hypothetical protein